MDARDAFRSELTAATLRAAREAVARFGSERIYSFALYTNGEYNYLFASVSTQAGLERVARHYLEKPDFQRRWETLDVAMAQLKWSPCDSPHHVALEDGFAAAQAQLDMLWDAIEVEDVDDEDFDDEWGDDDYSHLCSFVVQASAEALDGVRRAGIFDEGVTFNILMGDQGEDERLLYAAALNDTAVVGRLREDFGVAARHRSVEREDDPA